MSPDSDQGRDGSVILSGLAEALQCLLNDGDFEKDVTSALGAIGTACEADRAYIFENIFGRDGDPEAVRYIYEWVSAGTAPYLGDPLLDNVPYTPDFLAWKIELSRGRPIHGPVASRPRCERRLMVHQKIRALAVVPIFVETRFWGILGFDDCKQPRNWRDSELRVLEAAAAGFSSAISRHSATIRLREANEELARQAFELQKSQRVALSLIEDARLSQERAANANAAKSSFLAVMSHEMRTPLNGILGFLDLLMMEDLSSSASDYARTASENGKILLRLINDLLDLSKIESGSIEIQTTAEHYREAVQADLTTLRKLAEAKGLNLSVEIDPSVPEILEIDLGRYRQILMNIVGNAIKFTQEGSVDVAVRIRSSADEWLQLETVVSDTGIGIDADSLQRIFLPFDQAHSGIQRRFGGTGLGLSICRELCHLMHGSIDVTSAPSRGSVFRFSIRTKPGHAPPLPRNSEPGARTPHLAQMVSGRILVVDDVAANRKLLVMLLRKLGFEPEAVSSGEEAVAVCRSKPFDLIFMDVFMPGLDGYETTREIRRAAPGPNHKPVIIALSADALDENHRKCLDAGMNGFLSKPIQIPKLIATIETALAPASPTEV